ncbi:MAG: LysR family transcriptional regulator [Rikenellaceae bacterium]
MDFRLRVFVAVAKRLSFTDAATELNISQPAITNHIKELEKQYHITLFDRSVGKIKLTYAGEIFLNHTEKILERYKILDFTMEALTKESKGTLCIGANSMISNYILPPVLAGFNALHSNIGVMLHTGSNKQVEQALLDSKIDIAFFEREYKRSELSYHLLKREELLLVTNASNTNVNDEISIDEFFTLPLLVRDKESDILRTIDKTLLGKGLISSHLNAVMSFDNTESIKGVLKNSLNFSILPQSSIKKEIEDGIYKVIKINDLTFISKLYAAHKKENEDNLRVIFSNFVANSTID